MKNVLVGFALIATAGVAAALGAWRSAPQADADALHPRASIDDPEPPPADCPLCGGDLGLHQRRVAALILTQSEWTFRLVNQRL